MTTLCKTDGKPQSPTCGTVNPLQNQVTKFCKGSTFFCVAAAAFKAGNPISSSSLKCWKLCLLPNHLYIRPFFFFFLLSTLRQCYCSPGSFLPGGLRHSVNSKQSRVPLGNTEFHTILGHQFPPAP